MKKWLQAAFAALFITFALVACGGTPGPTVTPDPPPETEVTPDPDPQPDPDPEPEPAPFVQLRSGMAASIVIGQDDFVSKSEANPQKKFAGHTAIRLLLMGCCTFQTTLVKE